MAALSRHKTAVQIFLIPAIIAVIIAFGLVSALLGDGVSDALSWLALLLPMVVITYYGLRKPSQRP
jgi:hypothetical protein